MTLNAEEIGRLCARDTASPMPPLEVTRELSRNHAEALGQLTQVIGELYEELEAARKEPAAIARWLEEYGIGARSIIHQTMMRKFERSFPAAMG